MGFTTRVQAAETLGLLQTENLIDQAVGALMADRDIPSDEAHQKAQTSAQRAGISDAQMARAILSLLATAPNKERD